MPKHKPEEYRAIAAWGQMMHSYQYYIDAQQEQASQDDAPLDAIYKRDKWHTLREVENPETRAHFCHFHPDLVPAEWLSIKGEGSC
jgi:hypothetical protein